MANAVLDYIGLNLSKIPKKIYSTKPEYKISKSFDNSNLYKVYKKISAKEVEILISNTDRTTDIKERYITSLPLQEYIKEEKENFLHLAENACVDEIKNIEELQQQFSEKIPYFIKYDKNYLWQIYYSKEENKYFMLFPANEGETDVLFYLIKQKLAKEDTKIYVPICKEECSDEFFGAKKISDIENYIWGFTKEWPAIYEVVDDKYKMHITGKTKVQENFSSDYRIEINNKDEAIATYSLLKALFILTAETKNIYKFNPQIDKKGRLVFAYNEKVIDIKNIQEFITSETAKQQNMKYKLKKEIEADNKKIEKLKEIIRKQNEVYSKQEKQIVMFMDCKKSFLKRVRFFLKNNKKAFAVNKSMIKNIKAEVEKTERSENFEIAENEDNLDVSKMFTITDLVQTALETKKVLNEERTLQADIKAYKLKEENLNHKIENAQVYLDEIEKHKKSLFEFWKFTNKDNQNTLQQGQKEEKEEKKRASFILEEDLPEFAQKIDAMQRQKLSIEECNAIFVAKYLLPAINSVVTKSDTYIIDEEFEKLKENYKVEDRFENIFGGINDDSTNIKVLNNKKHRESHKSLYSILRFNETTTLDDFKEILREYGTLLNEAYQKIVSTHDMPIYYSKRNKGYIIANIDPYKLLEDPEVDKIYKMHTSQDLHLIYLTNIIFYDNYNRTLPLGMDESTEIILKVGENKKIGETSINILMQNDLFNAEVRKIKVIKEERR